MLGHDAGGQAYIQTELTPGRETTELQDTMGQAHPAWHEVEVGLQNDKHHEPDHWLIQWEIPGCFHTWNLHLQACFGGIPAYTQSV